MHCEKRQPLFQGRETANLRTGENLDAFIIFRSTAPFNVGEEKQTRRRGPTRFQGWMRRAGRPRSAFGGAPPLLGFPFQVAFAEDLRLKGLDLRLFFPGVGGKPGFHASLLQKVL